MKLVVDTNVFISGIFFAGPPHLILNAWHEGRIHLIASPEILEEYRRVGEELAIEFPGVDLRPWLNLITLKAQVVISPALLEPVCADPDDDKFFACALASRAKLIASGDKHLLAVSGYRGVEVLKPRDIVDRYISKRD